MTKMLPFDFPDATPIDPTPMIIDSFAGGGGASTGIELALGRSPDVAINHDAAAISMHEANHPETQHYNCNIWHADPADVTRGRRVGLAWFSPDCKHHSKAKGGKPVSQGVRDLAWVVVLWAKRARPEVIMLENVEEFRFWGPLDENNRPCKERKGQTFDKWVSELERLGYNVEWRELRACDYGAPTIRKRLFMIARCDGQPIIWPETTHGAPDDPRVLAGELKPYVTAADIIDWSQPCPSIFESGKEIFAKHGMRARRPLAEATLKRIARGVKRYMIDAKDPFLVSSSRGPAFPALVQTGYGEAKGQAPRSLDHNAPIGTLVAGGGKHGVVAAFLAQHNGGPAMLNNSGRPANQPISTLTTTGAQQGIVSASLLRLQGNDRRDGDIRTPHPTQSVGGTNSEVVAAFLEQYGSSNSEPSEEPSSPVVSANNGEKYTIADIGMRMLNPREMFRAQGFAENYIIDQGADGKALTKAEQTRMCGNSVCPPLAEALVSANCRHLAHEEAVEAA